MPVLLTIITRDDIADYVSGRLSRQQEEEVARLIDTDPRARTIADEIRQTRPCMRARSGPAPAELEREDQ